MKRNAELKAIDKEVDGEKGLPRSTHGRKKKKRKMRGRK